MCLDSQKTFQCLFRLLTKMTVHQCPPYSKIFPQHCLFGVSTSFRNTFFFFSCDLTESSDTDSVLDITEFPRIRPNNMSVCEYEYICVCIYILYIYIYIISVVVLMPLIQYYEYNSSTRSPVKHPYVPRNHHSLFLNFLF